MMSVGHLGEDPGRWCILVSHDDPVNDNDNNDDVDDDYCKTL